MKANWMKWNGNRKAIRKMTHLFSTDNNNNSSHISDDDDSNDENWPSELQIDAAGAAVGRWCCCYCCCSDFIFQRKVFFLFIAVAFVCRTRSQFENVNNCRFCTPLLRSFSFIFRSSLDLSRSALSKCQILRCQSIATLFFLLFTLLFI